MSNNVLANAETPMPGRVPQSPVIVALDFDNRRDCEQLVAQLDPALCRVKVGKELFTREGPALIRQLQTGGFDVFLDLKYHDIPNTVAGACQAAVDLGVWMVNVHASGGERMLQAARDAVPVNGHTRLIAVTVLTSMTDEELRAVGVSANAAQQVLHLAALTRNCGLDGIVCSPRESSQLRSQMGNDFLLVTPGVRPQGSDAGDQRRTMTPAEAIKAGSSYLVIGRPITTAADPAKALVSIHSSLS